jgi:hypothetical protein
MLSLLAWYQPARRGDDPPPRQPVNALQRVADCSCRAGKSGLRRHLAVGHDFPWEQTPDDRCDRFVEVH